MARRPVLLVGSVPLSSASDVFEQVGRRLGGACPCCPDGETGERLHWIGWAWDQLAENPSIEVESEIEIPGPVPQKLKRLRVRNGVDPASLDLRPMGYSREAIRSYAAFVEAREAGKIQEGMRFQVSIPTPFAITAGLGGEAGLLQAVERALAGEIRDIVAAVPTEDLAIQWDIAAETEREEALRHPERARGILRNLPHWRLEDALDSAARACGFVPAGVKLGIHLCYGDPDGKHLIEPVDATVMTEIANGLTERSPRVIDWIHFPVPIERDDAPYFAPFKALKLNPATQVYLGLVHQEDETEGARRRMAAADTVLSSYGVATECGLGRLPPDTIPHVLDVHRAVAEL